MEYRTNYYGLAGQTQALLNYEVALYESGTPAFQFIYGSITPATIANDSQLVVGVKNTDTNFTQYGCDTTGGQSPPVTSGQVLTAILTPCGDANTTPTPTAGTPTPTPTCGPAAWQSGPPQPPARYAHPGRASARTTCSTSPAARPPTRRRPCTTRSRAMTTRPTPGATSPRCPSPSARPLPARANGKIYVAGGFIGGTSVTNALRIYDIATNTWTSGANMPTSPGVEAAAAAVVNGKFYVMGGDDFNNGLNTTFIYDIATNTWTTGATLPDMRTNLYGTVANGLIYVYGGVVLPAFTTTDTLLRYDPVANSWTNLGSAGTAGARGNYGGISPIGHGPTADHRRRGRQWFLHHRHPHLHHQQRYVQRRPGDDRQPRRARAGHPARWPGAGRRRFQHGEHHGEYGRTAHHPLPECYAYSNSNGDSSPLQQHRLQRLRQQQQLRPL